MQETSEAKWNELWICIAAQGDPHPVYQKLITRYSEAHRKYHNLEHIEHCLQEFREIQRYAKFANAIHFALFLHDSIYDTQSSLNEEMSASWASQIIKSAQIHHSFADRIANLILATKHTQPSDDFDTQLICDIDLTPLGKPEKLFDVDGDHIRQEYSWVPQKEYVVGRSTFLNSLLARPAIYQTAYFREKYEAIARDNLKRAIANLPLTRD